MVGVVAHVVAHNQEIVRVEVRTGNAFVEHELNRRYLRVPWLFYSNVTVAEIFVVWEPPETFRSFSPLVVVNFHPRITPPIRSAFELAALSTFGADHIIQGNGRGQGKIPITQAASLKVDDYASLVRTWQEN